MRAEVEKNGPELGSKDNSLLPSSGNYEPVAEKQNENIRYTNFFSVLSKLMTRSVTLHFAETTRHEQTDY